MEGTPRTTRLRWLPNAITILRLAGIPVLIWLVAQADGPTAPEVAIVFFALAATDFVDGKLARALHAESAFGRVADPLADRLLMAVGLISLIVLDRFPWPGPAIILARDLTAMAAFVVLARRGVTLRVDTPGKISSALAMIAVALALLLDRTWVDVLFWAAVALSIATFVNYGRGAVRRARISGST